MFILSTFLITRRNQTWVLIRSLIFLARAKQGLLFIAQRAVYGAYTDVTAGRSPVLTETVNVTAHFRLNSVNLYVLDSFDLGRPHVPQNRNGQCQPAMRSCNEVLLVK